MSDLQKMIEENIKTLEEMEIEFFINIDNTIYKNIKTYSSPIISVKYKGERNVIINFYDNINNIYLLSLDKILREYCHIEYSTNIEEEEDIFFQFLSRIKPHIKIEKTIENIKNTLFNTFNLKEVEFYLLDKKTFIDSHELNFSLVDDNVSYYCNFNTMIIPIFFEGSKLAYFELKKEKSFSLYDIALINKLFAYIEKTIENSLLENKFEIILDKSLNIMTSILETRVPGAEKHCENISTIAVKIGEKLNLDKKSIQNLKFGSMIFDIGKIGIPEKILSKKEELTKEENEIIRKHVIYGYGLVSKVPTIPDDVKKIVLYHHEKWNGEGYPEGLKGNEIPMLAQIIGLLDTYFSLLEDRPYRSKLPKFKATELIDSYSGIFFNPLLVDVLKEVI